MDSSRKITNFPSLKELFYRSLPDGFPRLTCHYFFRQQDSFCEIKSAKKWKFSRLLLATLLPSIRYIAQELGGRMDWSLAGKGPQNSFGSIKRTLVLGKFFLG
jgi:hypothetical protein